jgi:hypothetical protein
VQNGSHSTQNSGRNSGIENLTPWPKGVSGNPGGRPKRKPIFEALQRNITDADLDAMARALVKELRRGDLFALSFARDTLDGKPTRAVELSGPIDLVSRMLERLRQFEEAEEAQK